MLRLLEEYTVAVTVEDHPVYAGASYRSGGVLEVKKGAKVIPLYLLESDTDNGRVYMAQLVNEDGSSGHKIRVYEGEIEQEQQPVRPSLQAAYNEIEEHYRAGAYLFSTPTTGTTVISSPYINTADSILREE